MVELVIVGFVAGFVAGISPCILPVLPGGARRRRDRRRCAAGAVRRGRPRRPTAAVAVVAGLVAQLQPADPGRLGDHLAAAPARRTRCATPASRCWSWSGSAT